MFRPTKTIMLAPAVLENLEADLNQHAFRGITLGSALNDYLRINALEGKYEFNFKARILDNLRYIKYYLKTHKKHSFISLPKKDYLFTCVGAKPSIVKLVVPLVEKLGPENCLVLSVNDEIKKQMPSGSTVVNVHSLGFWGNENWRKEHHRVEKQWKIIIKKYIAKYQLPKGLLIHILDSLLVQSRRVITYENLLAKVKPRAVITEYDRNFMAAPLILTANKMGIKTFTMMHGMVNEYGYTPILADKVFCWGQQHRDQLLEKDVSTDKIVITGNHRFMQNKFDNLDEIKFKAELDKNKPLVVLASSNITKAHKKQLARNYCLAFNDSPDITAMVRLHPNEKPADFEEEIRDYPGIKFSESKELTTDEIIAITDIFVIHNSGLGNDALMQNKIVVVFDCLPLELMNGLVIHQKATMPLVKRPEELRNIVDRILINKNYKSDLIKKAGNYSNYLCSCTGETAVKNIINVVKR